MAADLLDTPFFRGISQCDLAIRQYRGKVPMFFADARVMGGVFPIDLAAARRLLPDPRFEAATAFPGRALLGVFAFDYGYSDLGPYREAFVSISIHYGSSPVPHPLRVANGLLRRTLDAHVVQLPVNSEAALFGGIDLFGVPKFMADLQFDDEGLERVCRVGEPGGPTLFTLRCLRPTLRATGRFSPLREQTFRNYALMEQGVVLGKFVLHSPIAGLSLGPKSARLELGQHPRAGMLNELGLGNALGCFVAEGSEAILFPPAYL